VELRGDDHYEVTLGDDLRGERASLGKTLSDVERELRIKADVVQAIEECDLSGFPNRSVVAGYVRSYARYLGRDPEEVYRRFCEVSGFVAPNVALAAASRGGRGSKTRRMLSASPLDDSRFAVQPAQARFAARIPLGSVVSGVALMLLMAGLSYGGYALLQNMQRVGFAPLPEAPDVVAEAPRITAPDYAQAVAGRPDAAAYGSEGPLSAAYAGDQRPPVPRRDGPISEIDPGNAGLFAASVSVLGAGAAPETPAPTPVVARVDSVDDLIEIAEADEAARAAEIVEMEERLARLKAEEEKTAQPEPPRAIAIHAVNEAWIRVRNADRAIVFEGLLAPGESYTLPDRVVRGQLRAGNAGDVYIVLDGEPYGPVGRPGSVVKNLSLARTDVRESFAQADRTAILGPEPGSDERRAEVAED